MRFDCFDEAGRFVGQAVSLRPIVNRPSDMQISDQPNSADLQQSPTGGLTTRRRLTTCPTFRTSFAVGALLLASYPALAQPGQPAPAQPSYSMQDGDLRPALPGALQGVGIEQKLDYQVPLDIVMHDEAGRDVTLQSFFQSKKPVILAPVYYRCPMLCTQILTGLESALKVVSFNPARDFEIVAFSFDPKDTPELAGRKKELYLRRYARPGTANGWHFLTGDPANIQRLLNAIGYHVKYDEKTDQYAHASAVMILTPDGRLSRYFYGVEYSPRDLRLGLVEASEGKIGTPVDQVLLFCFHYDPSTGKYGAIAMGSLRWAGGLFVLVSGAFLLIVFRREARHQKPGGNRAG